MLELKSTHTPGLTSAPAMRGTHTHKRISESTINTIKNPAMLRARLHLLSHKDSLILSGKQKEINFLTFIGRCGHRAKAALGAYAGPVWSQSATGPSVFSALLQWKAATSHPQSHQSQPQGGPSCGTSSPGPQQTPHLYKTMGFIQGSLLIPVLGAFFVATTSTVCKQHFQYPYSSIPAPCHKFTPSYPCIMPMDLEGIAAEAGWNSTAPA